MAIRHIRLDGRKVWQARVAYQGLRTSTIRPTKQAARDADAEILQALKVRAGQAEQAGGRPATLRQLFEFYAADLEARGKGADSIARAVEMAHVVERLMPELLDRPVSRIGEVELFAFRKLRVSDSTAARRLLERAGRLREAGYKEAAEALERQAVTRAREGTKPSTINRDLRTLRAALKRARARLSVSRWRLPPGGRDARSMASSGGGAAAGGRPPAALPRDRQARGAHPHAALRGPSAASRDGAPRARRRAAPTGEGRRPAGDPQRRGPEDPAGPT